MNKSKLARDLDISRTMLYKLIARGMPTDSLEAAIEWRWSWLNMDLTQTKLYRIDGNKGVNRELNQVNYSDELEALNNVDLDAELNQLSSNLEHKVVSKVLTHTVPEIWFDQVGWLGACLRDHGVKITAEQLLKVQSHLYLVYMYEVIEYLKEDDELRFHISNALNAESGDEIYPSLMARLNQILDAEPAH
tara:strand:+ start:609 stop:1181 length:573 start_codon:yes stop_codon:yes gene_type:complete